MNIKKVLNDLGNIHHNENFILFIKFKTQERSFYLINNYCILEVIKLLLCKNNAEIKINNQNKQLVG
jgi:hypothetical protein